MISFLRKTCIYSNTNLRECVDCFHFQTIFFILNLQLFVSFTLRSSILIPSFWYKGWITMNTKKLCFKVEADSTQRFYGFNTKSFLLLLKMLFDHKQLLYNCFQKTSIILSETITLLSLSILLKLGEFMLLTTFFFH